MHRHQRPLLLVSCAFALVTVVPAHPQSPLADLIRENAPVIAITHVSVIDGTGAPAEADQTVLLRDGKIDSVVSSAGAQTPPNAKVIDGSGKTLIPGLVGMHEHLFYTAPTMRMNLFIEQPSSAPQLYLASGVTTARTAGSMEPFADLYVKRQVDAGLLAGPKFHLTGPYLDGTPSSFPQMHGLSGPDEAREFVRYWHSLGFTSMKAYMGIAPDELRAAIEESHKLGIRITGHLCSVGFIEAAEMGIDNLEHGPFVAPDSELYSKRKPGNCGPFYRDLRKELLSTVDPDGPQIQQLIRNLIQHHVAVTSTLAVFESGSRPPMERVEASRGYDLMTPAQWSFIMLHRAYDISSDADSQTILKKEMRFERAFVQAGGVLLAGCDPTGDGHTMAGLGDQRELELLVEAGFSVPEAVQIFTLNGARFLGEDQQIGSITPGKHADLVLLTGDLSKDVNSIEHPVLVFKDGIGFDSEKIYASLNGVVGLR